MPDTLSATQLVLGGFIVNRVDIKVGAVPIGRARTWAYPDGDPREHYKIPTYKVTVSARSTGGKVVSRAFEALRFGIQKDGAIGPRVVGLANQQSHVIKSWIPTYTVHSARSPERGAWKVYGNFLIHDGPDNPHTEVYASIGCVEICNGPEGFNIFNNYIISLANPTSTNRARQLLEIGRSGKLVITYAKANRPAVVRW
jgi:hypothetical protein